MTKWSLWSVMVVGLCMGLAGQAVADPLSRNSIGRLNTGSGGYCTSTLIDTDLAVTAAHCLFNRRTNRWISADSLHLLLGYDRGHYEHHARVKSYTRGNFDPDAWSTSARGDWALLKLTQPVPASIRHISPLRWTTPDARIFVTPGYGLPRAYKQWETSECMASLQDGLIISHCATARGMSGAPLIDRATGKMLGIQIAGKLDGGQPILIAVPATAWDS